MSSILRRSCLVVTHTRPYSTQPTQPSRPAWLTAHLNDTLPPPRILRWTSPSSCSSPSSLTSLPTPDPRRIHILGIGNIGRLFAVQLSKIRPNPPPITLVLHRRELLDQWTARPGIEITRAGTVEVTRDGLDVECWDISSSFSTTATTGSRSHDQQQPGGEIATISNLIVATKADAALDQVDRLRRYLDRSSTVAFAQNGMSRMWPPHGPAYVSHRYGDNAPSFAACITTHGVFSHGPFRSEHASVADVRTGLVLPSGSGGNYLVDTIASAPGLSAHRASRGDLWTLQLEKLAVNSVVNPLTAVLRCRNGRLFAHGHSDSNSGSGSAVISRVMDRLLREISDIYVALINHPGADGVVLAEGMDRRRLAERFSFHALRRLVWQVGVRTGDNKSSMLQDVAAGKRTEIAELNGCIIDMARFLDPSGTTLTVSANQRLVNLVEGAKVLDQEGLGRALLG
ncbi:2-dehydropantoate 2-reductase [Geosmithia morbida]|uniref:2-dehydropantoate 2-reductase n=1 Tax=Geosmithia morbida TaxID=1094350 RepID=A0A9P5D3A7_9HYPO|nr:2-dehydropantoate 2-reductase [Geosmithia morbida]KAF4120319.1 2-dehydropantoate 2-reductase [Geosmithia morbida]